MAIIFGGKMRQIGVLIPYIVEKSNTVKGDIHMKKQKPTRKEQSVEELAEYFSDWQYDPERQCINKLMREHPEVRDPFVIEAAAEEMLEAAYTGVLLSTDDALRLVEYMEPAPVEKLVQMLADAGINDDNIFDIIANANLSDEDYSDCVQSRHARHTANFLQRYADLLTRNEDIILLRLPVCDRHDNQAYLMLAFLGDKLSLIEQRILEQMKSVADRTHIKTEYEITRISFYIENVWEKL